MRRMLFVCVCAVAFAWAASTSRSDTSPQIDAEASNPDEPIVGARIVPAPGFEAIRKNPFEPYSIGDPNEAAWSYTTIGGEERNYVDRNRDVSRWDNIHDVYATAVQARAVEAAANAAAIQLGIDNLGEVAP